MRPTNRSKSLIGEIGSAEVDADQRGSCCFHVAFALSHAFGDFSYRDSAEIWDAALEVSTRDDTDAKVGILVSWR